MNLLRRISSAKILAINEIPLKWLAILRLRIWAWIKKRRKMIHTWVGIVMYNRFRWISKFFFYFQILFPYFDPGDFENRIEKFFWCPLVAENRKNIIYNNLTTWIDYVVLGLWEVCEKFCFFNIIVKIWSKNIWLLITWQKWLFW